MYLYMYRTVFLKDFFLSSSIFEDNLNCTLLPKMLAVLQKQNHLTKKAYQTVNNQKKCQILEEERNNLCTQDEENSWFVKKQSKNKRDIFF